MGDEFEFDSDELPSADKFLSFALAKYGASIVASPLEVVSICRQAEYAPTTLPQKFLRQAQNAQDQLNGMGSSEPDVSDKDDKDHAAEEDDDDDDFEYTHTHEDDTSSHHNTESQSNNEDILDTIRLDRSKASSLVALEHVESADSVGYLVRTNTIMDDSDEDDPTRPPYEISLCHGSNWNGISKIVTLETEGFQSLWKGQFAGWLYDMMKMIIQPSIEFLLVDILNVKEDASIPFNHMDDATSALALVITADTITGVALSPLELVRTRLITQTSHPYHRTYKGTLDALAKISSTESFYNAPLLLPTLLHSLTSSLFKHATPYFISRALHLDPIDQPILYRCAEICVSLLELILVVPLETVRRRLEVQGTWGYRGGSGATMIRVSEVPYTGLFHCINRIMKEEGRTRRVQRGRRKIRSKDTEHSRGWVECIEDQLGLSLRGLYRGFKFRFYTNASIFVLRALAPDDE